MQVIKVVKDSPSEQDFYKSGAIHTKGGEPPNSVSRPMPKGKPIAAKPFTKGKLIKPGGPGGRPSKFSNTNRNTKPVAQPNGGATQGRNMPAAPAAVSMANHTRNNPSASSGRSVPPPPPSAPPAAAAPPREPQYRVLYDFNGQSANEITMAKDELVTILQKENNGWWLAKHPSGQQGWAPSAYLKEEAPPPPPPVAPAARPMPPPPPPAAAKSNGHGPVVRAKPTPPAPPAKRPAAGGRKPAPPPAPRDSGLSVNGTDSGRSTPTPSFAGGLAEALKARQSAMQRDRDEEADW